MGNAIKTADSVGGALKRYSDVFLGVGVIGLLVTLVTPLPPWALDLLLATNMTAGVLLLMVTMNARTSTELSTLPTILLFSTLFRLGLNVASTRLILTGGEAGQVISAFGEYVGGDNLGVGLVVFLILIIIQFVVITKGSGRISEVAARFVLDAMPGKQMAIDADLNAGLLDSDTAKERRSEIAAEAEFYGAMDGASKFVRGDAIAGLIITGLNLVGGVTIGTMAGMGIGDAVDRYSKLTIGDGLVSQIPALFVSTAAAVLVTKDTSDSSLGPKLMGQLSGRPKATLIAAITMFLIGLLPGMPKLPFFILATVLTIVWNATRVDQKAVAESEAAERDAEAEVDPRVQEEDEVNELLRIDRVGLEIGYRLIPLVQDGHGGGILDHVAQLRRRFALRHGVVVPPVRIKDNIKLPPKGYRITIGGQEVAAGEVHPGRYLAMDSGGASGQLKGDETVDPAFGLPAWWVDERARDEAEVLGYTVIDPTSVLVTHLSETLRDVLGELLSRDDVKDLIDAAKETSPAVVAELVPDKMSYGAIQRVLRNLLAEDVPVRNMPVILEALADNADKSRDPETLTELVRQRMARVLCEQYASEGGTLHAVTLDPSIEQRLAAAVGTGDSDAPPVNPAWLQSLMEQVGAQVAQATQAGTNVVLLVRSNVRRFVGEMVRASLPKVAVLSYNEVVPARAVETVAVVKMEE